MATLILTNAKIWWDGYDLSGDHNEIRIAHGVDELPFDKFGSLTHLVKAGLKRSGISGDGWWNAGTDQADGVLHSKVGVAGTALAVSPDGGDEGEVGYLMKPLESMYSFGAAVGELLPFSTKAAAQSDLVRGTVMQNGLESATGSGTARQLGAVAAGKSLYAALHVFGSNGSSPTLDVLVRSDDNSGMSSPTTRVTFSQATGRTSQWATPVAGAITDDWWDISWTIGGTGGPDFTFVVVVGIL
jgi:hypothetical protein